MEKYGIYNGVTAVAAGGYGIFSDNFIEVKFMNYGLANLAACGNVFSSRDGGKFRKKLQLLATRDVHQNAFLGGNREFCYSCN